MFADVIVTRWMILYGQLIRATILYGDLLDTRMQDYATNVLSPKGELKPVFSISGEVDSQAVVPLELRSESVTLSLKEHSTMRQNPCQKLTTVE